MNYFLQVYSLTFIEELVINLDGYTNLLISVGDFYIFWHNNYMSTTLHPQLASYVWILRVGSNSTGCPLDNNLWWRIFRVLFIACATGKKQTSSQQVGDFPQEHVARGKFDSGSQDAILKSIWTVTVPFRVPTRNGWRTQVRVIWERSIYREMITKIEVE